MQEKVKKKTFMIITIVGIIMLSAVTFVNADNIQTEGEIISHLKDYDVIDLIDEFDNEAKKTENPEDLIYHAIALSQKFKYIPINKLSKEIADDNNSPELRVTLLQLATDEGITGKIEPVIKNLVTNKKTPVEVRQNAIWALSNCRLIFDIANGDTDSEFISAIALKKLNIDDPVVANKIADEILKKNTNLNINNDRDRMAFRIKAEYIGYHKEKITDKEVKEYINLCKKLYQEGNTEFAKERIVFALSDIKDIRGIDFVLKLKDIDNCMKVYIVDENHETLKKAVNSKYRDTVVKAMQIYKVQEIVDMLED
ncbi:MAG: hypothetical protein GX612_06710 [Bacteroidales bacterium]|nr:hypothetical protein [Bacteroidales bacterium]